MAAVSLKAHLRGALLAHVAGMGTIDLYRIDPDDRPRAMGQQNASSPYWSLTMGGAADTPRSFGTGSSTRCIEREYSLRLEGWRTIQGTAEATDAWDGMVDAAMNALELWSCLPAEVGADAVTALRDLRDVRDIYRGPNNGRAHHCLITGQLGVFLTLQRRT